MRDNPFPAVHGRVCYHVCEDHCIRADIDDAIQIHGVERFLGDLAIQQGWEAPKPKMESGKRVLVVGAGPSGLSAAYHLSQKGHEVTMVDAGPMAGGMMHFGIPRYRLPRDILMAEIRRIEKMGVRIVLNHRVTDVLGEMAEGDYAAVFLAIGAHLSQRSDIPARDAGRVMDALSYLKQVESGEAPQLGRRVVIYGGGNTAMDTARTVNRLGSTEAVIIYRRDRDHMPAHESEAIDAEEEGIRIQWLRTIREIDATTFTVEKMKLNAEGWPEPTGDYEELEADSLILALGQKTDTSFLAGISGIELNSNGTVKVDDRMMTGYPGIYVGGDMAPDERTVTVAVGHGKKAAFHRDLFLREKSWLPDRKHDPVKNDMMHRWYYTDAAQKKERQIEMKRRLSTFDEVSEGLDEQAMRYEAKRCLSCGNCFECDGCYGACPETAIIKLGVGHRYRFDYDRCTGCAVCFDQCPCGAISMIAEDSKET